MWRSYKVDMVDTYQKPDKCKEKGIDLNQTVMSISDKLIQKIKQYKRWRLLEPGGEQYERC